jgi:hypothetical protein
MSRMTKGTMKSKNSEGKKWSAFATGVLYVKRGSKRIRNGRN